LGWVGQPFSGFVGLLVNGWMGGPFCRLMDLVVDGWDGWAIFSFFRQVFHWLFGPFGGCMGWVGHLVLFLEGLLMA
jgi:hypothetical protein